MVQKLRDKCRSALHFTCFALGDDGYRFSVLNLLTCSRVWRKFAGKMQKCLDSPESFLTIQKDLVGRKGIFWDCFAESAKMFPDNLQDMQNMGLVITIDGPAFDVYLDDWSVEKFIQREMARKIWRLHDSLQKEYLRGFNVMYDGYPSPFVNLLDESVDVVQNAWMDMSEDRQAYLRYADSEVTMLKQIVKRSPMQWTEVKEMFNTITAI